jgi:hypothetical protein
MSTNSHGITIAQLLRVPPRPTLTQLNDLAIERGMDPLWPDGVGHGKFNALAHAAILAIWREENPDAATKPRDKDRPAGRGGEVPSISNRHQIERLRMQPPPAVPPARDAVGNPRLVETIQVTDAAWDSQITD